MKTKQLIWIVLGVLLAAVVIIAGTSAMLRTVNSPADTTAGTTTAASSAPDTPAPVPSRPTCPPGGAGGVELPCLGAEAAEVGVDRPVTVVNVWAWWCGPCRDELPYLDEFAQAHPEYEVVGVHADPNAGNGAALLNELGISLPSFQDADNTFAGTLGLPGVIPITVVFEGNAQIAMFPRTFNSAEEIYQAVLEAENAP
ncbi:Thiol-disulfide oxidoreductase ResA [Corynebacterium atrinae]|uniref:TlpA family protein disulfide reductase n=1 Tax=Corynebacterium atrinae TaxID=1336740 RepID=UPI0025B56423|nr:TlpA disulfide reductase family protein [Corynebacterium atrinae]WJY62358.1 Thiol-disulfide oxidoreductase ResA [Corynebacterium atrinae]